MKDTGSVLNIQKITHTFLVKKNNWFYTAYVFALALLY